MSNSFHKTGAGLASFQPLAAPRRLGHELVERITADIASGKLPPGARLPTEQEIIASTGVSRTVVREAVAALRAQGLVVTRQGVGAFVAEDTRRPFHIDEDKLRSIQELLQVIELRIGVEVEAAGLAADRASEADRGAIVEACAAIDQAMNRSDNFVEEDFAFHRAIATATGNPQFINFLQYLGGLLVPRQLQLKSPHEIEAKRAYFAKVQREHYDIRDAILACTASAARTAMRRHLENSRKKYQKLATELGED
jgi:GntR family transcriptional regulator, transcriptional repressor for pyruvate dehydrogenase complex